MIWTAASPMSLTSRTVRGGVEARWENGSELGARDNIDRGSSDELDVPDDPRGAESPMSLTSRAMRWPRRPRRLKKSGGDLTE
eukprot:CAMPEP_0204573394 /NCGR_PEP_ID=MMETSP0661-20131031/39999_1 /ASSEMBLY_ACC=CAM_ASM_000606 /TAXON_ID=109239 /ORGANISM="Alexandrium margalefi, Strain AMGDE01CS-322" /LENGTH=82 /DNA_ID=CAMNT_0051581815 /DNA_START=123 /DNA_END=372 /DNA_ORIENTATION=-